MQDQQLPSEINEQETPSPGKISWQIVAVLFFILFIVGMGMYLGLSSRRGNTQQRQNSDSLKTTPLNLAPYTLVYGTWTQDNSVIKAVDLTSGNLYTLATLPSNIKKVSVIDQNRLLYIDNTDNKDHGSQISIYSISNKKSTPIIKASDGYGIDDYVLSANKRYMADWEVIASSSGILFGGRSRVYTVDLQHPSVKHLIYDEAAIFPVHYPRAILDNGTVYTDRFLPNSGAGWAYGMSMSNFNGSQKQDLANMRNGTYGTQPVLSPDGKYLAFAGYDGSEYSGADLINGFRQSIVDPNTIELLDTTTNTRIKLPGLSSKNIYANLNWDSPTTLVYYQNNQTNPKESGIYIYNLVTKQATKLNTPPISEAVVVAADKNTILAGDGKNTLQGVNNLGSKYQPNYSQLYVMSLQKPTMTLIPMPDTIPQYIAFLPTDYYANSSLSSSILSTSNDQLHLKPFILKISLAPVRQAQQSNPVPGTSNPQSPGASDSESCYPDPICYSPNLPTCSNLANTECPGHTNNCEPTLAQQGKCWDSPLYLYGLPGTKVKVTVDTPVFDSTPAYSNGFAVTLGENGAMMINGKEYSKLSYDYLSAIGNVFSPSYGSVSSQGNLTQTIQRYAENLGLNQRETHDLVAFASQNIHSPYVFFSFYNDKISKEILPLTFSPQPDVYRSIAFYFKQLDQKPSYSIPPPKFDRIRRHGLTAIEISELVR